MYVCVCTHRSLLKLNMHYGRIQFYEGRWNGNKNLRTKMQNVKFSAIEDEFIPTFSSGE